MSRKQVRKYLSVIPKHKKIKYGAGLVKVVIKNRTFKLLLRYSRNEYEKITGFDNGKHVLKVCYHTYVENRKKLRKVLKVCDFCGIKMNNKLTGIMYCSRCKKWGCYFHFCRNIKCVGCTFSRAERLNYFDIPDITVFKVLSYVILPNKTTILLAFNVANKQYYWVYNILDSYKAKFCRENKLDQFGYLDIYFKITKHSIKSEKYIAGYKKGEETVYKQAKKLYKNKLYNKDEKMCSVYLKKNKKLESVFKDRPCLKQVFVMEKFVKMVDGETSYGLKSVNDVIHPSVAGRCLEWTKYVRHCMKREVFVKNNRKYYRINNGFLYNHELSTDGYFMYKDNGEIVLYNQYNYNGIYRPKQQQKLQFGNFFATIDKDVRLTKHYLPSTGGISIKEFPDLNIFCREIYQINSTILQLFHENSTDYSTSFNGIQINRCNVIKRGKALGPTWHWDAKSLYSTGLLNGIFTVHLQGWNSFLTNSLMNCSFRKDIIKKEPRYIAEKVLKTGIVKKPLSSYLITDISTSYVDHCVLQSTVLAQIKREYNDLLKERFSSQVYNHYKLEASSEVIGQTTTESWLFRAHPIS